MDRSTYLPFRTASHILHTLHEQGFLQTELKSYTLPNSYMVNNVTVSVADPSVIPVDDGPSGVPTAIVVSSILSAVVIFVGMALFTRYANG